MVTHALADLIRAAGGEVRLRAPVSRILAWADMVGASTWPGAGAAPASGMLLAQRLLT